MLKGAIEPVPVEDTFLTGVHWIEHLPGDLIRYWLYVEEDGEHVIKAKNVFPMCAVAKMQHVHHQAFVAINGTDRPRVIKSE